MNGMDRHTGKPLGGMDHLRQSIGDILGTPLGTRLCRRDYGSALPELLDQPMNELTRIQIYAASALAIMRLAPRRVRLTRVGITAASTDGTAELTIAGTARDTTGRRPFNFTLPVRAQSALAPFPPSN
jgi:phage baseplate assembly protein W